MFASSLSSSFGSVFSSTGAGLAANGSVKGDPFLLALQSASVRYGVQASSSGDAPARNLKQDYSATLFSYLFGAEQSAQNRSGCNGLLDLLGAGNVAGADMTFHGGRYKTLGQVGTDFANDFANLTGTLGSLFSGFTLGGGGLSMRLDGQGHVLAETAEGDGNSAAGATGKANQLFAANNTLVSRFAVMAARGAIVDAANSLPDFQQDYNANPPEAIRTHIDQLGERLFGFRLGYSAAGFNATVDGRDLSADAASAAA